MFECSIFPDTDSIPKVTHSTRDFKIEVRNGKIVDRELGDGFE